MLLLRRTATSPSIAEWSLAGPKQQGKGLTSSTPSSMNIPSVEKLRESVPDFLVCEEMVSDFQWKCVTSCNFFKRFCIKCKHKKKRRMQRFF